MINSQWIKDNDKLSRREKRFILHTMFTNYVYSKSSALELMTYKPIPGLPYYNSGIRRAENALEIYSLLNKVGLTEMESVKLWENILKERSALRAPYRLKPLGETRDNRSTSNKGSGYAQRGWIRVPSKKRPKSTWNRFYKLFPWKAPKDHPLYRELIPWQIRNQVTEADKILNKKNV